MRLARILAATVLPILLGQESGPVSFDLDCCDASLTLDTGPAMPANSYVAGLPWGLVRSWLTANRDWRGLTTLELVSR